MAVITFTDATGAVTLRPRRPGTLGRFASWVPLDRPIGETREALATGDVTFYAYREDFGVLCEMPGISAHPHPGCLPSGTSPLTLAVRLVRHLNTGGSILLDPEGADGATYTCKRLPGATIADPSLTNPALLEYGLALALKNTTAAIMPHPYTATATSL